MKKILLVGLVLSGLVLSGCNDDNDDSDVYSGVSGVMVKTESSVTPPYTLYYCDDGFFKLTWDNGSGDVWAGEWDNEYYDVNMGSQGDYDRVSFDFNSEYYVSDGIGNSVDLQHYTVTSTGSSSGNLPSTIVDYQNNISGSLCH